LFQLANVLPADCVVVYLLLFVLVLVLRILWIWGCGVILWFFYRKVSDDCSQRDKQDKANHKAGNPAVFSALSLSLLRLPGHWVVRLRWILIGIDLNFFHGDLSDVGISHLQSFPQWISGVDLSEIG
jgi:hypothetical protein